MVWNDCLKEADLLERKRAELLPYAQDIAMGIDAFVDDEEAALQHFSYQILLICGDIDGEPPKLIKKRTWRVGASAVGYFRRFYASKSMITHDPRTMMMASLFLAGKIEEHYQSFILPPELARVYPKCDSASLLAAERQLVQELGFAVRIAHPHNCMYTLLCKVRGVAGESMSGEQVDAWTKSCLELIRRLSTTKASLLVPPVFIACFCLSQSAASPDHIARLNEVIESEEVVPPEVKQQYEGVLDRELQRSCAGENYERIHQFLVKLKTMKRWNVAPVEEFQSMN